MPDYPTRPRPPMPAGVIVALVGIAIFLLLGFLGLTLGPTAEGGLRLMIAGVFFAYLWLGHPLAWQWALYFAVVYMLVAGAGLFFAMGLEDHHSPAVTILGLALTAMPILVIGGLTPRSSRRYFDLQCPECQAYKVRAASFLFNKIRCSKCKATWRLREERVPVDAFD